MKYIKRFESIDWDFIEEENPDIMFDFDGNEDFYNFLVDNGVLDKFIKNLKGKNLKEFLRKNKYYREDFINVAFIWDKTPDGHDFWCSLDNKWIKIINGKNN